MESGLAEGEPGCLFSVVTYIPAPLGPFLDALRQELVPSCSLRAHITILPPRRLAVTQEAAWARIQRQALRFPPIEIIVNDVEVFSISSVVYLEVGAGFQALQDLHDRLNTDSLRAEEAYPYRPHITLAQEMADEQVAGVFELARRRWAEFRGPRSFTVARVTFVRGKTLDCWTDLAECPVGPATWTLPRRM